MIRARAGALFALASLAACGRAVSGADALREEGLRTYHGQYCGTCHTFTPAGTAGIFGPTHDGLRRTVEGRLRDGSYTGEATTPEEYVRESVTHPGAYRVPGYERTRFLMPAYTNLSDEEVDALVRLLLDPPPTNTGGG